MNIRFLNWNYQVRVKLTGLFFILIGLALITSRDESVFQKLGFSAIFIGIFAIFVITEKAVPKILFDAQMLSNMELLNSIVRDQELQGNGIYLPARNGLSKERVFVPKSKDRNEQKMALSDDTVFVAGSEPEVLGEGGTDGSSSSGTPIFKKTEIGAVFVPPGLELLETLEGEKGKTVKDLNIEELEKYLKIMIIGLEIIRDLSIKMEGEKDIAFVITHMYYRDVCSRVCKDMDGICRQTGCPICSSILCAITRTLEKEVRIVDVKVKKDQVEYNLEIGD